MNTLKNPGMTVFCATSLALVFSCLALATPKPETEQPSLNNLQETGQRFFDKVLVKPGLDLSAANKVYVDTPSVEFSRYWKREHRSDVSNMHKEKTLERYSRILGEQITEAIANSKSFQVVNNRADADLVLVPKIDKLNIYAPDDFIGDSLVYRAGYGRFMLEMVDAQSGESLLHIVDGRETVDRGYSHPVRANRATNTRDFRMLMEKWSKRSLEYLEDLKK